MDQNTISEIESIKTNVDSSISGLQAQSSALADVLEVAQNGWQTDQQTIADGIAAGLETANARIATLSEWIVNNGGDLDTIK